MSSDPTLSRDELAAIAEQHQPCNVDSLDHCTCHEDPVWPCDTSRLLAHLAAVEEALRHVTDALRSSPVVVGETMTEATARWETDRGAAIREAEGVLR